ncbi:MAG: DUF4325 domain-containing protein [Proteobacteria bacterium]|nr:DUF4325 domain-containing protein [Pseudomonadota bacterium]
MTTSRKSRQNPLVREFILNSVEEHPADIVAFAAKEFQLSRAAVNKYVKRLIDEKFLTATGKTYARRYGLAAISENYAAFDVTKNMSENDIWRDNVLPYIKDLPSNVVDICQYGFTEMFNNVIDHSESEKAYVFYEQTPKWVKISVLDEGIGIFEKIQKDFNLADPRSALLELSKGKLTSDSTRHSGEGVFFTSRMFDEFSIKSGHLLYVKTKKIDFEWLIGTEDIMEYYKGTSIIMKISPSASWTTNDIYQLFQDDGYRFAKTHVPIELGRYPGEQLVSRSQAKRVLARVARFSEVLLDFHGVQQIGQAFADEIFRVFQNEHPEVRLIAMRTSAEIDQMIVRVKAGGESQGLDALAAASTPVEKPS